MLRHGRIRQIFATVSVNILACSLGASSVWPSYSLPYLGTEGDDSSFTPITKRDEKLIISLYPVGGVFGAILFAYSVKVLRRKTILKITSMLHAIAYILIAYAYNGVMIMASRFMLGMAASGLSITIPLFVSEIADDKIRGALGGVFTLMLSIGIVLSYGMSLFMKYYYIVWVFLLFPVLFLTSAQFFHESAPYWIRNGDPAKAKDSLVFYRGVKTVNDSRVQLEYHSLQQYIRFYDTVDENMQMSDFLTKASKKSIIIGAVLVALEYFSGYTIMMTKAKEIFQHTDNISPEMAAIFIHLFEIFGILFAIAFVDTFGRKVLLAMSSIGVAFGILVYGMSGHFMKTTTHPLIVGLVIATFSGGVGIRSLPYVVIAEICPENIRDAAISICVTLSWLFSIAVVRFHESITEAFGEQVASQYYGITCITGASFIIFVMSETKGMSLLGICDKMKN